MSPFIRFVHLFPPSLQWVPWPLLAEALRFPIFIGTMGCKTAQPSVRASYGLPLVAHFLQTLRRRSFWSERDGELSWVPGQPLWKHALG